MVMLPIETDAMTRAAAKLKAANIPLIIVDREVKTDDFAALIKGDNVGIGANAATYIGQALGGSGSVVEIIGVPASVTVQRSQGFRDAVAKSYPGLKVIASQCRGLPAREVAQRDAERAAAAPEDRCRLHPRRRWPSACCEAIREAKRTDIKVVTGAGGSKAVYKLIADKDPVMKATFVYSPLMVKDAVKVAVDVARGSKPAQQGHHDPRAPR